MPRDKFLHLGEGGSAWRVNEYELALLKAIAKQEGYESDSEAIRQIIREAAQRRRISINKRSDHLLKLLNAAKNALISYKYGNQSPDLADEIIEAIDRS